MPNFIMHCSQKADLTRKLLQRRKKQYTALSACIYSQLQVICIGAFGWRPGLNKTISSNCWNEEERSLKHCNLSTHLKRAQETKPSLRRPNRSMEKASSRGRINFILEDIASFTKQFQTLRFGNHDRMFRHFILQVSGGRVRF